MSAQPRSAAAIAALPHYIDGEFVAGESGRSAPVFDPSTGEVSATVGLASRVEVDRAVKAADAAFAGWAAVSPLRRARVMFKFKGLLETHHDELARIIVREHGKVFSDAQVR